MATTTMALDYAFDPGFLARQRAELAARRASCAEEKERLSAAAVELVDEGTGRDGGGDEDFGEGDTVEVELDRIRSLLIVLSARIEGIDGALARLDADAYGMCDTCRQPISAARLEALPESTHCVSCKSGHRWRRLGLGQPSFLG